MIKKLERIGSNCLNLLSGTATCNLTNRDFSGCAIPYAYLCKRDFQGCNFSYSNMENCLISEAKLDDSYFIETNLKNL